MNIQELKKELGLSNKEIAQFFNMTYGAFANSSAKQRYEDAICKFYSFLKGEGEKEKKTGKQNKPTNEVETKPCNIYGVVLRSEQLFCSNCIYFDECSIDCNTTKTCTLYKTAK